MNTTAAVPTAKQPSDTDAKYLLSRNVRQHRQCSACVTHDSGTYLMTETHVTQLSVDPSGGEKCGNQPNNVCAWYPRIVSSYALTENAPWIHRLDADLKNETNTNLCPVRVAEADFYGHEDVDTAALARKPISFAIFGKPGIADDQLAAMLAAYWGCIHVSPALGLVSSRIDDRIMWKLNRGDAVNIAEGSLLFGLLGLESSEIRERGYVLTGLPRYNPEMSANEQIHTIFAKNPPDVLIYISFSSRELYKYRDGLILESMDHKHLMQMLHKQDDDFVLCNHEHVQWYKTFRNTIMAEFDLNDYEKHSLMAVDEAFKRFDADMTITLDGRKPVVELFETIKAKLKTMPLQRTVLPEIIREERSTTSQKKNKTYIIRGHSEMEEMEDELDYEDEYESEINNEYDEITDKGNSRSINDQRNERVRLKSEFGQLCPVNFYYGLFKLGTDRNTVKFMGKLYFFAGLDEMQLFVKFPRQFVSVPRLGLPIRAIFYGPEALSSAAAKTVSNFFGFNLIDTLPIRQKRSKNDKRSFVSTIINSVLKTAREITTISEQQSNAISVMRNTVGDWIRLNYNHSSAEDNITEFEFNNLTDSNENEENDNYTYLESLSSLDQNTPDLVKEGQLTEMRNFFQSYFIDLIDDLDECIRVYNNPRILIKYFRKRFLRENEIIQPNLIDVVVDYVRTRNKQSKNWIIVNAPLDYQLVNKLIDFDLNPIQMVFFSDVDVAHKILLNDETLNRNRNKMIEKTFENVKNGTRHGELIERVKYSEFVSKIENIVHNDNQYEEYELLEEELEVENESYENRSDIIDSHIKLNHNYIMGIIFPEIIGRLNHYTEDLLQQWNALKRQYFKVNDKYIDFNVIECKSNPTANMLSVLIEDTLYYIKKFLSEDVYDMSIMFFDDNVPTEDKYNGDTSIYCPVSFKNSKLSVGCKEFSAVYQNRYHYMSSLKHLKAFISNPVKYSSFTSNPKMYPKPKISLLYSFGCNAVDFIKNLLDTFNDYTLIDSYTIFKQNILLKNTPMLGKMYEQPMLKKIMDENFITTNQNKKCINSLRKYVNRESAYLSDENWAKLNSVFSQSDDSIFYTNYPRSLAELKYLKDNEINPDVIVEVVEADNENEQKCAKNIAIKNWLTYQYAMIEKVVEYDDKTRQITVGKRSILFKNKLAELVNWKKTDSIKSRLKIVVDMIATETEYGLNNSIEHDCQNQSLLLFSKMDLMMSTFSNLQSRYFEITLKQKKIIIEYGLATKDLEDLNDFGTLERINTVIQDEFPEAEFLISKCFLDTLKLPSDTMIAAHLNTEKNILVSMRKFARSFSIPWITTVLSTDGQDSRSSSLCNDIAKVLPSGGNDNCVFETTFEVNIDEAERMLRSSEVYLSKYGRWCPVRARNENSETSVQRFYGDSVEGRAFAVLHRKYVYFLSGPEYRDEFGRRPLHYACRPFSAPANIVLRLAVIGPPGSGKSRISQSLCDRYGLQLVRIEQAMEAYLEVNGWTDNAQSAVHKLYRGDTLNDVMLVEAVKMAVQSTLAVVCGYVLDGFPITEKQFKLFDDSGIILHRVFVIQNVMFCDDYDDDHVSNALLQYRQHAWNAAFVGLEWISDRYGNTTAIRTGIDDGYDENRMVIDLAVRTFLRSAREYSKAMREGRPAHLAGLAVTNRERRYKMSSFLNLCPVCRVDKNCFNDGPDQDPTQNLIQYLSFIYRVCSVHWNAFMEDPDRFADLAPRDPEPVPVHVTDEELSLNPYVQLENISVYCVVCALRRLWDPTYSRGNREHLVKYGKRVYALCSVECRGVFMQQPFKYAEYVMCVLGPAGDESSHCNLEVDNLPVPGYLEQTMARFISDALITLSAMKPVYPGLTVGVTAIVYLGLYVGMNGTDDDLNEHYHNVFTRFVDTCHRFKSEVFRLKLMT